MSGALIEIKELNKKYALSSSFFGSQKRVIHAVKNIDLQILKGETLGLVGESGCGKSTLARLITRLEEPSSGHVNFKSEDKISCSRRASGKPLPSQFSECHLTAN